MTRMMVLCSLPRTNPGNRKEYKRVNGPYRLYMQAGPETKLPFGKIPSLLLPVSYYLFLKGYLCGEGLISWKTSFSAIRLLSGVLAANVLLSGRDP